MDKRPVFTQSITTATFSLISDIMSQTIEARTTGMLKGAAAAARARAETAEEEAEVLRVAVGAVPGPSGPPGCCSLRLGGRRTHRRSLRRPRLSQVPHGPPQC